tara:strand:+ start:592 stop:1092 length:501 start_codon:yes stop_codon:yes gene_type:complete
MEIVDILFAFFGAMVVLPVIYMLITRNIIRAAFALVISLLGIAAIYVLLNAELMAVVQILIYAGGIIVLLIFGIMLTKRVSDEGVVSEHRNVILGSALATILLGLITWGIFQSGLVWEGKPNTVDQVRAIGISFMTDYLLSFEVIAFLLLVALVGASYLAKRSGNI